MERQYSYWISWEYDGDLPLHDKKPSEVIDALIALNTFEGNPEPYIIHLLRCLKHGGIKNMPTAAHVTRLRALGIHLFENF